MLSNYNLSHDQDVGSQSRSSESGTGRSESRIGQRANQESHVRRLAGTEAGVEGSHEQGLEQRHAGSVVVQTAPIHGFLV